MAAQTDDRVTACLRWCGQCDGKGCVVFASGCQLGINEHVLLGVEALDIVYTICIVDTIDTWNL